MMTDTQALLKKYATNRSEDAFRGLVIRYLGLVYSTALRQVDCDIQAAEDVSQIVFADLAKDAANFSADVMLGGWLHQRALNVARTMMRSERRRQAREKEAVEMSLLEDHTAANLARIGHALDEAITQLNPEDRVAIILRYFERHDLRSVGEALGVNEDAAQKRVSRALDKMRLTLQRSGASISASALGAVLAAEEATAAPAGLAAVITAAALSSATTTHAVLAAASKAIGMTALQKTIASTTIAALVVAGIYEGYRASRLSREKETLQQEQSGKLQQLQHERDEMAQKVAVLTEQNELLNRNAAELLRLRDQVSTMRSKEDAGQGRDPAKTSMTAWLGRVKAFKELPTRMPARTIPEVKLLSEDDWLELAKGDYSGSAQAQPCWPNLSGI